jgi:pyruvate dehydrogenase E1 component alpha subunit
MRWHGHNEGEEAFSGNYRPEDELATWRDRDPIVSLWARLVEWQSHDAATLDAVWREEGDRVEAAVAFAESSPLPDPDEALRHVFFSAEEEGAVR